MTLIGKKNRREKAKASRKEKQMHFNYEKLGSEDEQDQQDDVLKFGNLLLTTQLLPEIEL